MTVEEKDLIEEIKRRAWQTSGARFAAHHRLSRKHLWSTWAVAVLSIYLIAGSLAGMVVEIAPPQQKVVNLGLALASMLVLVLSLIEASKSYQLKAERLHGCAVALRDLELRCLGAAIIVPGPEREKTADELRERFHEIKRACPDNHEDVDFAVFRAEHADLFALNRWDRFVISTQSALATAGWSILAISAPVALLALLRRMLLF